MLRFLLPMVLLIRSLSGQQIVIGLDAHQTQIDWSLDGNVHTTHGTFRLKQGHVTFDPATRDVSGEVVADATSGDSGNAMRDKRMNNEILQSSQYPEFRFVPQKVVGSLEHSGPSHLSISGTFWIHGASHSLTIPVDVSRDREVVKVTGQFSIPYVEWGMKDPSNFLFKVGKAVEVRVVAAGHVDLK